MIMSIRLSSLTMIVVLFVCVTTAIAQTVPGREPQQQVEERTFQILHADPEAILAAIRPLLSARGTVAADVTNRLVIVMDTPDKLEAVRALILELDIPPDRLQLTFYIFSARQGAAGEETKLDLPKDVETALAEVKRLMKYDEFALLDRGLLTLLSGAERGRIALSERFEISFATDYNQRTKYLHMNDFSIYHRKDAAVRQLLQSDIGIGDGEVVIAGVSRLAGSSDAVLVIVTFRAGADEQSRK
jgi:hypothetical protein